ncbi:hypothetical protein SLEP1_g4143 [Rubroshorea leprosula]|uniref:Uncharacterized protein n=1 Tax=Rubroshorea leprosula TaxID=152421 RepID=A0AAV5HU58_9ROSI|nr:hypothetical protein SLEP1_g4143 [Rubroshorea leprosula]
MNRCFPSALNLSPTHHAISRSTFIVIPFSSQPRRHYNPWPLLPCNARRSPPAELQGCRWVISSRLSPWHRVVNPSLQVSNAPHSPPLTSSLF